MTELFNLNEALSYVAKRGASDLHLGAGTVPMVRIDGRLEALPGGFAKSTPEEVQTIVDEMLSPDQRLRFSQELELDLAYSVPGVGRFRANLYRQRNSPGIAFRFIDNQIRSLEDLGMPIAVRKFATLPRGLVLVTGPTGSGKSTTLAAIIDRINRERAVHIMSVEDPIEFMHRNEKSIVNQREVGTDTHTFADALKHVLRQDPDVILIGELRDLESIAVALTAAETGHLVFATLHTTDAAQAIDRIVDVFPSNQQSQIRTQLAGSLQGVVAQTLLRRTGGGRVAATEILRMTPAIGHLVREGKTHQIYSQLQAGGEFGMHTMDQSLAQLVRDESVTHEEARSMAHDVASFESLAGRNLVDFSAGNDIPDVGFGNSLKDPLGDALGLRG